MGRRDEAMESTFTDPVHFTGRHPVALVVAVENFVIGPDGETIGIAQAVNDHVEILAIGREAKEGAVVRSDFGFHASFDWWPGRGFGEVEVFVEVGFVVAVQTRDLVAGGDIDFAVDDLHAVRLEKSGGESFPSEFAGGFLEPVD